MTLRGYGPRKPRGVKMNTEKLDEIVARARRQRDERLRGYREQSLKIHPWVCARCGRVFSREDLHELTVHHRDHDHDNNPPDGSNWENLCLYCHDNEHARHEDYLARIGVTDGKTKSGQTASYNPFAALKGLLDAKKE